MEGKEEITGESVRSANNVEENAKEHNHQGNDDSKIDNIENNDNMNISDEQDQKVLDALKVFETTIHQEILQDTLQINEQATSASTAMRELLLHKNERIATLRAENATRQSELDYALETINTLTRQLANCQTNLSISLTPATNVGTNQSIHTHDHDHDHDHDHEDTDKDNEVEVNSSHKQEDTTPVAVTQPCTWNSNDIARLYSEHVLLQNKIAQYELQEVHWRAIVERVNSTLEEIVQENITLRRQLLHYESTTIPIQNYTEIVTERNALKEQLQLTELKVNELIIYTDELQRKVTEECLGKKDNEEGEYKECEELKQRHEVEETENVESHSEHSVDSDNSSNDNNQLSQSSNQSTNLTSEESISNNNNNNNNSDIDKDLLEVENRDQQIQTEAAQQSAQQSAPLSAQCEMWDAAIAELEKKANAIVDYDQLVIKLKETEEQLSSTCNQNTELIKEINELRKINTCLRVDSHALEFRNKVFEEQVISLLGKVNMLYCSCSNLHKINYALRQWRKSGSSKWNNRLMPSHKRNHQLEEIERSRAQAPAPLYENKISSETKYHSSIEENEPKRTGRRLSVYSGRVPGFGLCANAKKEATATVKVTQATINDDMRFHKTSNYSNISNNNNNNNNKLQETELLLTGVACKQPNAAELNALHYLLCSTEEEHQNYGRLWSSLSAHDELSPFAVNSVQELVERNQELVRQLHLLSTNNMAHCTEKKTTHTTERSEQISAKTPNVEMTSTLSSDNSESDAANHDSTHVPQRKRRRVECVAASDESHFSEHNIINNNNVVVNVDSDSDEDVDEEIVSSSSVSSPREQYEEEQELSVENNSAASSYSSDNHPMKQTQSHNNNSDSQNTIKKMQEQNEYTQEQLYEYDELEQEEEEEEEGQGKEKSKDILSHQVKKIIKEIMESSLQADHAERLESKSRCYLSLLDVIYNSNSNKNNSKSSNNVGDQMHAKDQPEEQHHYLVSHLPHATETTQEFLAMFVKPLITLCVQQAMTLGKQQCLLLEQHERNTQAETSTWQSAQEMLLPVMEEMKSMINLSSRQLIEECHATKKSTTTNNINNNVDSDNIDTSSVLNTSEVDLMKEFISIIEIASRKENNIHRLQDIAYERHEAWMTEKANKLARLAAIAIKYNNYSNANGDNTECEREKELQEIENELFTDLTQRLAMAQDKVAQLHEELSSERSKYTAMYEQMWQLEISSHDAQYAKSALETQMQRMIAPETLHQVQEQLAQRDLALQEHENSNTQLMHDKETLIVERATLHDTIHRNEREFQFALSELEREVQHLRRIRNNVENRNAELQSSRLEDLATIHSLEEQLRASEHVHQELQEQLAQRAAELSLAKTIFLSSEQAQEALRTLYPYNTAVLAHNDVITHLQERLRTVTSALTTSEESLTEYSARMKQQDEELQQLMQVKEELQVQLLKCTQALKYNRTVSEDKSEHSLEAVILLPPSSSTHLQVNAGEHVAVESTASLPFSSAPAFQSCTVDVNTSAMTLSALRIQVRDLNALLSSTQSERDTLLRAQAQWKKREENLRAELEVLGNDPISATAKKYGLHAIKSFQEQIAEMYGRNEELVEERERISVQLDQLQRETEKQHHKNDLLSQEKSQLEHKIENANEEITLLQETLHTANMTSKELNDKLVAYESTIAADEETISRLQNECDNLQREVSECKDKCARVEAERDSYTRDNVELIGKLTEMQNVLQDSETEKKNIINNFDHERKELKTQIDELQHSLAAAKAAASSSSSSVFGSSSSMLFARAQARSRPPVSLTANLNINKEDSSPTGINRSSSNIATDANITWQSSVFGRQ